MKIVFLLVSSLWLTCNANNKLYNIITHVNSANVSWQVRMFHLSSYNILWYESSTMTINSKRYFAHFYETHYYGWYRRYTKSNTLLQICTNFTVSNEKSFFSLI